MKKIFVKKLLILSVSLSSLSFAGLETSGYDNVREVIKFDQPSSGFIYDANKDMLFKPIKKDVLPSDVLFPFNSSVLATLGEAKIADLVRNAPADAIFNVIGHTDHIGTSSYNMSLGKSRAMAVENAMVRAGIYRGRIISSSAGESEPVTIGCGKNIECLAPDRRVVIITNIPFKEEIKKFKNEIKNDDIFEGKDVIKINPIE